MTTRRRLALAAGACLALTAAGCAVQEYRKPALEMPVAWKTEPPWREGSPSDLAPKGDWWQRFGDPELSRLEEQALLANPTLAAASARLDQARATLAGATASLYPQLGFAGRAARFKDSANRPLTNYGTPNLSTVQNDFVAALAVSYEVDLSGRVRSTIDGARASAEQSAADFENTRLILTAELAAAYFGLREVDIELDVLFRSIDLQRKALDLATARHELGAASGLDVAQQQALLDSTRTQVDVLAKQRSEFEHAIAALMGTAPPLFALAPDVSPLMPPEIPLGVPSDVLQRRPDVASAERAMAASNAQIGVAKAAFYPSIFLVPGYGVESNALSSLFSASSILWSLGVSLTQTLFDGGHIQANVDFARAGYQISVATYRSVVLNAMQEAEDGITGLASLERATVQAQVAVESTRRVLDLANDRYEGGVATYLDVITAQQGLLTNERLAAQLQGQQMLTAVFLIKALGGDWVGPPQLSRADPASRADAN